MKDSKWDWKKKLKLLDGIELLKKMGVDTSFHESERIPPIKL